MLLGEHAVLNGSLSVVCAVNQRLHMQLIPTQDARITICDTRLGELTQDLIQLQVVAPFKFVLSAIMQLRDQIRSGFRLEINSEFSSVIGFGSSAAVTIATIAVIGLWLNDQAFAEEKIFSLAKQAMLQVQGYGSGADLAASLYGGVISYGIEALWREQLPILPALTAIYSGYKTPTPEVIKIVKQQQQSEPLRFAEIFAKISHCVQQAIAAIKAQDWSLLGKLFLQHHALQVALGVSDDLLDDIVARLSSQPQILGAKISGAGLGDCVIGLGAINQDLFSDYIKVQQFEVKVASKGLSYAGN